MSKYKTSAGLVAGLLMTIGGIASAQEGQMPEPTMDKVSDSVYHYFNFGYSSMVVIGEDAVLVIDPAFDPRGSMLRAAIEEITAAPIKYVVLSHEHYDHAGGADSFTDAQVICHAACHEVMDISPLLPVPDIDMTYDDSLTLDLGGVSVDLVHVAPGDGIATTVAHVPSDGVVFSADMYEPRAFTTAEFVEDKNYVGTRLIFHEMLSWNPTYAINGHSPGNSLEALKENRVLFDRLYDDILAELQSAQKEGPSQLWMAMFNMPNRINYEEYNDWQNYEQGFPAYVRRMALSILHGG